MEERPHVPMVRLERKEEIYDRDEVLGRDTSSVFPSQQKKEGGNPAAAALQQMLGTKSFVSQSELDEIRKERGLTGEEGSGEPLKPLAEVLRENRERKQQKFDETWQRMKQGKNTPLDPEELDFLDSIAEAEALRQREASQHERQELDEFRQMLAQQAAEKAAAEAEAQNPGQRQRPAPWGTKPSIGPKVEPKRPITHFPRPNLKAMVKPKGGPSKPHSESQQRPPEQQQQQQQQQQQGEGSTSEDGAEPQTKRPKLEEGSQAADTSKSEGSKDGEGGLAGLLGEYGSGSDSDGDT